jgi:glutamate-5-semialdehyde dehydrogenase
LADLPALVAPLIASKVLLYADEPAYAALEGHYPAHLLEHALPEHYGTEMLSYRLAIKTVQSLDEALDHIAHYSSRHSESIISNNAAACECFTREVDAACVYTNLPTSWTDGGQFGFGAEIGISTQKLHARGPMALPEITTYKYVITGDGQIRQ